MRHQTEERVTQLVEGRPRQLVRHHADAALRPAGHHHHLQVRGKREEERGVVCWETRVCGVGKFGFTVGYGEFAVCVYVVLIFENLRLPIIIIVISFFILIFILFIFFFL